mmetsp:Transcript_28539/g.40155  ORF Transcript_28539/g.40155 Transcript_28539/m.40155 type:complete len:211 (+) Transcript_28539:71-703(+)
MIITMQQNRSGSKSTNNKEEDSTWLVHNSLTEFTPSTKLSPDFMPTHLDVLCGRKKESREHVGTEHFRQVIKKNFHEYAKAKTRCEKASVVKSIVQLIRCEASAIGGAGFIRHDETSGFWIEMGDQFAREKVGHAFRDLMKQRTRMDGTDPKNVTHVPNDGTDITHTTKALLKKQQEIFAKFLEEDSGARKNTTKKPECGVEKKSDDQNA